jgi:hypothetical protein
VGGWVSEARYLALSLMCICPKDATFCTIAPLNRRYHGGQYGAELVKGIQGVDVSPPWIKMAAALKHFAVCVANHFGACCACCLLAKLICPSLEMTLLF